MNVRTTLAGCVLAALIALDGCGGGHGASSVPTVSGSSSTKKPDAMTSFTLRYPTNLIHGMKAKAAKRSPKFLDPGSPGYTPLIVAVSSSNAGGTSTSCVTAAPLPNGTQQISIGEYSEGGTIAVHEYQSGDASTCTPGNGSPTLAKTDDYNPAGYGSFTPGSDVSAPTVQLFAVLSEVLYSEDQQNWYVMSGNGDNIGVCGDPLTLYFAGADADGVGIGSQVAIPVPSPTPSSLPSPTPTGGSALNQGFSTPTFSNFSENGISYTGGPVPGSVTLTPDSGNGTYSINFNVNVNDLLYNNDTYLSPSENVSTAYCES